jgi:hypothetical protein
VATVAVMQTVTGLEPGTTYTVSFATNVVDRNAGFWGVMVDDVPYRAVDTRDGSGPAVWNLNSFDFTAAAGGSATVKFEVITREPGAVFKLDDVRLA